MIPLSLLPFDEITLRQVQAEPVIDHGELVEP